MTLLYFDHPVHPSIKGSCAVPKDLQEIPKAIQEPRPVAKAVSVYRYQSREIKSIWGGGELRPSLARQLRPELRIVMGFWRQPGISTMSKAELSGCRNSGEFLEINRRLLTEPEFNQVDAIRHCILYGLPMSAAAEMTASIICKSCGLRTKILPCVNCWRGLDDDPTLDSGDSELIHGAMQDVADTELCQLYRPTKAMPGSEEKLAVLRERVENGVPLWHPEDPVFDMLQRSKWWIHD